MRSIIPLLQIGALTGRLSFKYSETSQTNRLDTNLDGCALNLAGDCAEFRKLNGATTDKTPGLNLLNAPGPTPRKEMRECLRCFDSSCWNDRRQKFAENSHQGDLLGELFTCFPSLTCFSRRTPCPKKIVPHRQAAE